MLLNQAACTVWEVYTKYTLKQADVLGLTKRVNGRHNIVQRVASTSSPNATSQPSLLSHTADSCSHHCSPTQQAAVTGTRWVASDTGSHPFRVNEQPSIAGNVSHPRRCTGANWKRELPPKTVYPESQTWPLLLY